MKKILIYRKKINSLSNKYLLLLLLIIFVSTSAFSQNNFVKSRNYKSDFSESTLLPIKKIDGIKFDYLNKVETENIVEADTALPNTISNIWYNSNELNITIHIPDKNKYISIKLYNMLGKEVMKIYEGTHTREDDAYVVQFNLPNGIYICVLQGDNFRDAKKIIVSR